MKHLYILIGNGSSISIVNKINDYRLQQGQSPLLIDLSNLFYYGAHFNFPMTNEPFLTQEHCPYLWQLGARPEMDGTKANQIISQIITCGNVYALAEYQEQIFSTNQFAYMDLQPPRSNDEIISHLYFAAYGEFSSYIRYLMIYYNNQITDNDLLHISVPLIDYIKANRTSYSRIIFNSYNYDILMERLLKLNNLPFILGCFEHGPSQIVFYKPHGSISFCYKETFAPGTSYHIPYDELSYQQHITLCDLDIKYDFNFVYPKHNGMIPPYGDAERYEIAYYQKIRNAIIHSAKKSFPDDPYYIIGSAYGTYDRFELDRINTSFDPLAEVFYVNPFPNLDYDAVLSSLFVHYKQVPDFVPPSL